MREHPDHHDAELMLRLYELRREEKLRRAREWFLHKLGNESLEDFLKKYPPGSEENAFFRMVVTYWDMVGSILNNGLIKQDFFFQNTGEFFAVWEKIKDLMPGLRQKYKNPHMWGNLEEMAAKYTEWMNNRAPGAIDAFRERVKASPKK